MLGARASRTASSRPPSYPDALARVLGGADVPDLGRRAAVGAAPGCEFPDWGGVDHVGGGSHGSLHHSDSLGALRSAA